MTAEETFHLAHAPIIEAVVDIDCDLPVGIELPAMEDRIRQQFSNDYPRFRRQMVQQQQFKVSIESPPEVSMQTAIQSYQFLKEDEKQLVQVRPDGFSFNRLAPYASFDEYLPEIERTWKRFVEVLSPVQIRRIALRYINRILLPTVDGEVEFDDYLLAGPRLPDEDALRVVGFMHQQSVREVKTGHQVNATLLMQPYEGDRLPILFDIETMHVAPVAPEAWENVRGTILSLRRLKNNIFRKTLTEQCLNLFL